MAVQSASMRVLAFNGEVQPKTRTPTILAVTKVTPVAVGNLLQIVELLDSAEFLLGVSDSPPGGLENDGSLW